jgi:hypothetical protein
MDAAFIVVFALFVVAMVGLAFMVVRWGVRQDRAARGARAAVPPDDSSGTTGR